MKRISISFAILGIILFCVLIYSHELAHQQIYASCDVNSTMNSCSIDAEGEKSGLDKCLLANNINDLIGYQIMPFYLLIFAGFYFILNLIEEKL